MFPAKYPINCPSLNIGPNFLSWPKTNIGILTRRQLDSLNVYHSIITSSTKRLSGTS